MGNIRIGKRSEAIDYILINNQSNNEFLNGWTYVDDSGNPLLKIDAWLGGAFPPIPQWDPVKGEGYPTPIAEVSTFGSPGNNWTASIQTETVYTSPEMVLLEMYKLFVNYSHVEGELPPGEYYDEEFLRLRSVVIAAVLDLGLNKHSRISTLTPHPFPTRWGEWVKNIPFICSPDFVKGHAIYSGSGEVKLTLKYGIINGVDVYVVDQYKRNDDYVYLYDDTKVIKRAPDEKFGPGVNELMNYFDLT